MYSIQKERKSITKKALLLLLLSILIIGGFLVLQELEKACCAPNPFLKFKESGVTWNVYKTVYTTQRKGSTIIDSSELRLVLMVVHTPGSVVSTASSPLGGAIATSSFLSASSYDPLEEDALRGFLEKAKSFEEFMVLLQNNGYTLEKVE
ncbi:MAG: hypothetical protein Q7S95_02220 [bacterium]|nr:hypothetical protein [bacterium]